MTLTRSQTEQYNEVPPTIKQTTVKIELDSSGSSADLCRQAIYKMGPICQNTVYAYNFEKHHDTRMISFRFILKRELSEISTTLNCSAGDIIQLGLTQAKIDGNDNVFINKGTKRQSKQHNQTPKCEAPYQTSKTASGFS